MVGFAAVSPEHACPPVRRRVKPRSLTIKRMPSASVVIPTYNRRLWVGAAVESVLAQDIVDLEVIVVDDGSTDGTAAMLAERFGNRIVIERLPHNRGRSTARNIGWQMACSDLIAFLDSDDLWLPGKLAAQLRCFDDPSVQLAHSWVGKVDGDGKDLVDASRALEGQFRTALRRGYGYDGITRTWCRLYTSAVVVRKAALTATGGFDPDLPEFEDWDLFWRIARLGRVATIPETLVLHRAHGHNISPVWADGAASWLKVNARHLRDLGPPGNAVDRRARANLLFNMALGEYWRRDYQESRHWMRRAIAANPRMLWRPTYYVWCAPLLHALLPYRVAERLIDWIGPDRYLPPERSGP